MKKSFVALVVTVAVLAVAGISFYAGMQYQKLIIRNQFAQRFGQGGAGQPGMPWGNPGAPNGMRSGAGGPGPGAFTENGTVSLVGKVDSVSDTRLTMTTRMGATTVRFEDTLRVLETTPASKNALSPGAQVLVEGKRESNGDITATKITVVK